MSWSSMSRLERESLRRRAAKKCPPHPPSKQFWQEGDAMTLDALVCGRCFAVLARRKHEVKSVSR
jgi:hypothetical protein